MNKRTLKKIVSIFKEGASPEVCIALILDLMPTDSSHIDKGIAIHTFYETIFSMEVNQEIFK